MSIRPIKWCDACQAETETYGNGSCAPCCRAKRRARVAADRDRYRAENRAHRNANIERERERDRLRYDPAKKAKQNRAYREANRERLLEYGRRRRLETLAECAERSKRWAQANPDKVRAAAQRRRARKMDALVHDVTEQMVWEFNPAGPGCCNYCGKAFAFEDRDEWQIDHVMPLFLGGLHELQNLVVACAFCNQSKGAKHPDEWTPKVAA